MTDSKFGTPVTADDVAAEAGVSRWTVARAFKPDASISLKSREKVMAAAERLGYVPDLSAASLASDRSNLVALITNDFNNPHKLVMFERLSRILWGAGWGTLLVNSAETEDASAALLAASQRRVDAAVVLGTRFDDKVLDTALGAHRVKKLVVFARYSQNPNTITIACDDHAAMRDIGGHLLERGYRRPLFVAGPDTQSAKLHRKDSFTDFWYGHTRRLVRTVHVEAYDMGAAALGVRDVLTSTGQDDWPDVLVCENDILAVGAMDLLRSSFGLQVPRDIGVTGFDDIPMAASPAYELTTYRQPITAMAECLVDILQGGEARNIYLPGEFIARASTRSPG